ncbi:hypothetical protein HID58_070761 [Brassica napus]|uniref:Uncharacterized protein n=1 Tax=Brassica napus TaxID=3708 RepID=A0ABQ7YZQ2_BRANA|nr:hypothetical protein HID58_070761 [Brassica napus]
MYHSGLLVLILCLDWMLTTHVLLYPFLEMDYTKDDGAGHKNLCVSLVCICIFYILSSSQYHEIKLPKYFLSCSLVHLSEILRPLGAMQMQSQKANEIEVGEPSDRRLSILVRRAPVNHRPPVTGSNPPRKVRKSEYFDQFKCNLTVTIF